jgi:hypothetical protein
MDTVPLRFALAPLQTSRALPAFGKMDDTASPNNPPADFNKLDLSQLQSFSFGTQWTQEKPASDDGRPRRDDRRDGPGGGERRDRRAFRRPAGPGDSPRPDDGQAPRREFSGDRRPRRDGPGGGEYRGGPRRDGPGGDRGAPRSAPAGRGGYDRGPYDSPFYAATFYPEDTSFNALAQTIRKSCRTIELFEIARTVVAKTDRFVVVVGLKPSAEGTAARKGFYVSVPDGIPFESDEAAVAHVLANHLGTFFEQAEVEVEPPKGNFQVINKCSLTGELLGPPNYHRYNQIVQQHHAARVGSRMSLEAFRTRIETVRDPEVVNQWLAKMKKTTRYTWKASVSAAPATPAAAPAEGAAPEAAPEAPAPLSFDTMEEARMHLLTTARDKVVRATDSVRVSGKTAEAMPDGEIRRAIEGAWERQRRFPLDTANALRGRLRREHFTIFKKGSKGVSYVCAVKRKFRVPGQTFSDTIGALISFIEANPMVRASELPAKFLNLIVPAAPAAGEAAPAEGAAAATPALSIDDRARLSRMQGDLVWLVREGYVTEFIDGRLFAPPPMVEARKKEIESEEHDPENFPEVPAEPAPAAAPEAPAAPAAENPPVS